MAGIKIDRDGYVAMVRCGLNHSGNNRIFILRGDRFGECCGCRRFYSRAELEAAQRSPPQGERGCGGLYTVART